MLYAVEFSKRAYRQLAILPRNIQERVSRQIDLLGNNPRPAASERVKGRSDLYRIRVGDYRIVYQVHDNILIVLVVRIGHRREVYKNL